MSPESHNCSSTIWKLKPLVGIWMVWHKGVFQERTEFYYLWSTSRIGKKSAQVIMVLTVRRFRNNLFISVGRHTRFVTFPQPSAWRINFGLSLNDKGNTFKNAKETFQWLIFNKMLYSLWLLPYRIYDNAPFDNVIVFPLVFRVYEWLSIKRSLWHQLHWDLPLQCDRSSERRVNVSEKGWCPFIKIPADE